MFKKAWAILEFLIENWDILKPLLTELIDTIKSQKNPKL